MFDKIRNWAKNKGIIEKGNITTQCLKLQEEVGELSKAILLLNKKEIKDGIGDCVVVLTTLATLAGLTIENCIEHAYSEIKDRKGKIINNNFVKNDKT